MTQITSEQCMTCRRTGYSSPEEREAAATHRMEHRRADRRRAQWRASKHRKKLGSFRLADGAFGSLHDLSCRGPRRCSCRPIAVYQRAAA